MKPHLYIPQNIIERMSPADRKKFGVQTTAEARAQTDLTLEREIHHQFGSWLYRHDFCDYYHSDPVRRPTIKAGLPDFGIYRDSRILFVEIKCKPNGLTQSQEECFERMGRQGNVIMICYSYKEACRVTSKFFNLP